jgi:hypothetical protein
MRVKCYTANASTAKMDLDSKKTKAETQSQFSNKEINVRRHGNLVQLILTPSSSTKVRNALTLQVSNFAYSLLRARRFSARFTKRNLSPLLLGDARIQGNSIDIEKGRRV